MHTIHKFLPFLVNKGLWIIYCKTFCCFSAIITAICFLSTLSTILPITGKPVFSVFARIIFYDTISAKAKADCYFCLRGNKKEREVSQMDNILLCSNHIPLVTSIHNTFIEKYMLGANGSYVKVYLYLSKCIQAGQEDLSISSLADQMENTEKDVIRALNYWEKKHLLKITRSEDKSVILGIDVLNPDELPEEQPGTPAPSSSPKQAAAASAVSPLKKTAEKQPRFHVTPEQTKRLTSNDEFRWTCNVVESYLERPVKPGELQLISYLYDSLGFSPELILYLYEYCISLGKTNTSYLQSVAIAWHEKQIKTPEEAQQASSTYNAGYTAISKAFALGRGLAAVEKQYVDRWQKQWNMDLSVILEACNRTMLKIQRADFKYTDGILDNWHKNKISTLLEVAKADEKFARNKAERRTLSPEQNGKKRPKNNYASYEQHGLSADDADALEKKLLRL